MLDLMKNSCRFRWELVLIAPLVSLIVTALVELICVSPVTGQSIIENDELVEDQEPPQLLDITINGQSTTIEPYKDEKVRVGDATMVVKARLHTIRKLHVRHLSFDYPSDFQFEAKVSESPNGFCKWDLKGRSVKISLQHMPNEVSFADYLQQMREEFTTNKFARRITSEKPVTRKLGNREVAGTTFDIEVGPDVRFLVEYLDLVVTDDKCRYVLVLADSSDSGNEEIYSVRQILERTFKFVD